MKKQIIFGCLLIILALALGLTGSALATNTAIQPRTTDGAENFIFDTENNGNEQKVGNELYGTSIPKNEEQGNTLEQEIRNMSTVSASQKDNKGVTVVIILIITVLIIAGLIIWWYRTNY